MFRVMDLPLSEIALDPGAASERVERTAARGDGWEAVGLGRAGDRLLVFFESPRRERAAGYRFAPFEGVSAPELIGEAGSRYAAGFSTVGVFELGAGCWGLFRRTGETAGGDGGRRL